MADQINVSAVAREASGSGQARRARREGWLPGVLNLEQGDPKSIQLNQHDFEVMLHHHSSDNLMVDMDLAGEKVGKVLMKDLQYHPVTGEILHVDFFQVSLTKKMTLSVQVVLVGEPTGVTLDGGILEQMVREIEVECLPGDLVESFELDISALGIGDSLRVGDIAFGDAFTLMSDPGVAVASVSAPRVEAEPTDEEGAEGAEGEGEGEGEAGEGEEAAEGAEPEAKE